MTDTPLANYTYIKLVKDYERGGVSLPANTLGIVLFRVAVVHFVSLYFRISLDDIWCLVA